MTLVLGLDIGGTKSAAVLGDDETGQVLARQAGPTPQGPWPESVAFLVKLLHAVRPSAGEITALGVSCGGPLNSQTGIVHTPPNLPHWNDVPLRNLLQAEFGLPVWVENDANATALAEHRWGAGQGTRDMAFLTMGTGIGAGLILNGELYRGRHDLAGEIGHTTIVPHGPPCLCGRRGCLETLSSGTAIGRMAGGRLAAGTHSERNAGALLAARLGRRKHCARRPGQQGAGHGRPGRRPLRPRSAKYFLTAKPTRAMIVS